MSGKLPICIVGGGPAGMMLGYLLARSGVHVQVLEKHADFLRDFRGDTVHPSTLQILDQCGLLEKFSQLPQQRVQFAAVTIGKQSLTPIDFRGLKPFDYIALVPQWDFLNFLAAEAKALPSFSLRMQHEARDLLVKDGKVVGVHVGSPAGEKVLPASLVIGCDGRSSVVRKALGLEVIDLGAPMDALWFSLPRNQDESDGLGAVVGAGHLLVMINRRDYWQIAYVVPKGSDKALRKHPINYLREKIAALSPALADRCELIESWDHVKTLVVTVDRLKRWHANGALVIGDAAHAMSPIGGVGINLAIQDAVAAANIIASAISNGEKIDDDVLARVQRRREKPTQKMQRFQVIAQNRIISSALENTGELPKIPSLLRWLTRFRWVRNIPARIIGYGFSRERVEASNFVGRG